MAKQEKKAHPKTASKRAVKAAVAKPEHDGFVFSGGIIAFFTAFIILLVRMHSYQRPMDQFFWSNGNTNLVDFFSYYKMLFILICAILAILVILYQFTTQTFRLQRSYAYYPMLIYVFFVALSYAFSPHKIFALFGFNDRFEGTLTLIAYMVMLFFVINSIKTESHIKWAIYPLAISSAILSILGLTQALDKDFFRTTIGKKLITPSSFWENLDSMSFTFENREIYQTVYNINYVSFYLTLLVPLFAMLFIYEKSVRRKVLWGILTGLLVFNLIGSKSSGGLGGLAFAVIIATIVLNKRLIQWKQPVLIVIALVLVIGGVTYQRWLPELSSAVNSALGRTAVVRETPEVETAAASVRPTIDYIITNEDSVELSFNGEPLIVNLSYYSDGKVEGMTLSDGDGAPIVMKPAEEAGTHTIEDERFYAFATISNAVNGNQHYILLNTVDESFPFAISENGLFYTTKTGRLVDLDIVPSFGWKNNLGFGSGRGYIWSRSLPMLKDTFLIGHGADTFAIEFPQHDYAGKYNARYRSPATIVDKPHSMYLGVAIGTGVFSLLALLALFGIYLAQSFRLYYRARYEDFLTFAGAGIFFGISGFLVAGLFNDSTVSVMPMFYGLLGTGIVINRLLGQKQ